MDVSENNKDTNESAGAMGPQEPLSLGYKVGVGRTMMEGQEKAVTTRPAIKAL